MLSKLTLGLLVALPLTLGQSVSSCPGPGDDDDPPPPTPIETPPPPTPVSSCMVTGCSGQVCASEPVATTCEWRCEYGCYQYATCEAQASGACGWTYSPKYEDCLKQCQSGF